MIMIMMNNEEEIFILLLLYVELYIQGQALIDDGCAAINFLYPIQSDPIFFKKKKKEEENAKPESLYSWEFVTVIIYLVFDDVFTYIYNDYLEK